MKLFVHILIISQVIISLNVFAEKNKKDSKDDNSIKWKKIDEKNSSNNLDKIIWKSYNDDESYFESDDLELSPKVKTTKNSMDI